MKKSINKIALRTDKIVSLSAKQAQQVVGGMPTNSYGCSIYFNSCRC